MKHSRSIHVRFPWFWCPSPSGFAAALPEHGLFVDFGAPLILGRSSGGNQFRVKLRSIMCSCGYPLRCRQGPGPDRRQEARNHVRCVCVCILLGNRNTFFVVRSLGGAATRFFYQGLGGRRARMPKRRLQKQVPATISVVVFLS